MNIRDSLIYLCIVLFIALFAVLNYQFFLQTETEKPTETGKPLFIHPKDAECAKAVGTETSDVQVYICHTEDDEYYYVRLTPATAINEGRVWTEEYNAE